MDLPQEFYHPIFSEKRVALEYIILEKLIIDTMELFKIIWSRNKGFNDNAYNRFIVIHGAWYVNEEFIKKYGRAGRSWGYSVVLIFLTKHQLSIL